MPLMSQPAFGPKLSIGFITGGCLLDVWTLVWRYTIAPDVLSDNQRFWYLGLLLTGIVFVVIGAFLGSIGRAARKAELPPASETRAEASIQANAAANPHPAVAAPMMQPGMPAPAGMVPVMPGTVQPQVVPGAMPPPAGNW